jgi:hypothetical protein
MPQQIQNDVVAVYEPVVTIAETGEVLTEAQIYDTTLACLNRTEFVRALSDTAAAAPEAFAVLREDFWSAIWTSGTARLDADILWRTTHLGSPAINGSAGVAAHPGQLVCQMPPSSQFYFGLGSSSDSPIGFITFQAATFVVSVTDDPANVATQFLIGLKEDWSLGNGGDNCLQLFYLHSQPNWQIMARRSGVQVLTDTGVPVVSGDFVTCRFLKNGNDIDVELNGSVVYTAVNGVDKPTGEGNIGATVIATGAETEVFTVKFDFIQARTAISGGDRAD